MSVLLSEHGGSGKVAVNPRGWGTSSDGSEQSRLEAVAISGVDGPACEAAACREPEPLVAAIVETSCRLAKSVGYSTKVGKLQRCSSREDVGVSVLVGADVGASSRPHRKAIA